MEDWSVEGYKKVIEGTGGYMNHISIKDDFTKYKIFEIINMCFHQEYKGFMKAWYDINDDYVAWFPKMASDGFESKYKDDNETWINTISSDGTKIIETNQSKVKGSYLERKYTEKHRLVFGKYSDGIHFLGLFDLIPEDNSEEYYMRTYTRIATEVDLTKLSETDANAKKIAVEVHKKGNEQVMYEQKNMILYGPPGTGKTYNTVIYAVAICDQQPVETLQQQDYSFVLKRYNELKAEGRIAFTTFHQSYGYEEFIEGIRPSTDDDNEISYKREDGIFKEFCDRAITSDIDDGYGINSSPTVWKVSLEGTGDNPTRKECLDNSHIRVGYNDIDPNNDEDKAKQGWNVVNAFANKMKIGDIVFSCYSARTVDAIGVVTGNYEKNEKYEDYQHVRSVKWLVKNVNEDIVDINDGTTMTLASVYRLKVSKDDALKLIKKFGGGIDLAPKYSKPYIFIIDEINRGNISKIFGELITLIEDSKRAGMPEAASAILPYSKLEFSVPKNVYILGTMNTADRSIAIMDTALRRRFSFKEMMPEPKLLNGVSVEYDGESIDVEAMLITINERIEYLYDREHTIGHAFFMPLKENASLEKLAGIFSKKIIPLLQEYFYEDYEKIRLVLGDNAKDPEYQFIKAEKKKSKDVFWGTGLDLDDSVKYELNEDALMKIKAYQQIYKL